MGWMAGWVELFTHAGWILHLLDFLCTPVRVSTTPHVLTHAWWGPHHPMHVYAHLVGSPLPYAHVYICLTCMPGWVPTILHTFTHIYEYLVGSPPPYTHLCIFLHTWWGLHHPMCTVHACVWVPTTLHAFMCLVDSDWLDFLNVPTTSN